MVQLCRYAIVGFAVNLSGYLVYLVITYLGATPKLTMTVLYGVGATIGFFANRKVTFSHSGSLLGAGLRFVLAHCGGYLINLGLLIILVDKFGFPHQAVQAIAIFAVAAYLFIVLKFFVFRTTGAAPTAG